MVKPSRQLAILLALVMALILSGPVRADDPTSPNVRSGSPPTEGHPWDDDVVEDDPGDPASPPSFTGLPGRAVSTTATTASARQRTSGLSQMFHSAWSRVLRMLDYKVNFKAMGSRRM